MIRPTGKWSFTFITTTSSHPISATELTQARKLTRQIARTHYENFLIGSVLLPRHMQQPLFDVYAFCRTADDLADCSATPGQAAVGLEDYRRRIAALFTEEQVAEPASGLSDNSRRAEPSVDLEATGLFIALADTVRRFQLPREPFDDLLDAFIQDQTVRRYRDEPSLLEYCHRSANPVGRLVLAMADCDTGDNVRLSDEICTGLQLTNFWQDMARDYAVGRIYLPDSVMHQHGFDESLIDATIGQRAPTPACIRDAVASQCHQARLRLERGRPLVQKVSPWLAADLELFISGGLATLDAIERIKFDVLRHRPKVGKTKQAYLVACTWLRTIVRGRNGA